MPTISEMAKRLSAHDESGAMHIVVSDGNLDDGNIRFCLEQPDVTDEDRELAKDLLTMNEADREAAWDAAFGPEGEAEVI